MAKRRRLQPPRRNRHHQQRPGPKPHPSKDAARSTSTPKKQKRQRQLERPAIVPFEPQDHILLLGEGDLSFAASLISHHGCVNVTATVLERDHAELVAKYPAVDANVAVILDTGREGGLGDGVAVGGSEEQGGRRCPDDSPGEHDDQESRGADDDTGAESDSPQVKPSLSRRNRLLYNVDATKLPPALTRPPRFNHIIFNFPHVGGKSTDVNRQVRHNQSLLVAVFECATSALAPRGSIVVTLFEGEPYTLWNVRDLARHAGLAVERSFCFLPVAYPGYRHARTCGVVKSRRGEPGGGWKGEDRAARSYVFRRKGELDTQPVGSKKRRRGQDDSSDDTDDDDDDD